MARVLVGPYTPLHAFHRDDADGAIAPAAVLLTKARATGLSRVVGNFHADAEAATGFPRVQQSEDGINWSITDILVRDTGQIDFQYPVDIRIKLPWVRVVWTQGVVGAAFMRAWIQLVPTPGDPKVQIEPATGVGTLIESAPGDFAGAITQNFSALANIGGLPSNKVVIRNAAIVSIDPLDWFVAFYTSAVAPGLLVASNTFIGGVMLSTNDAVRIFDYPGAAAHYLYSKEILIPYFDEDLTSTLHVVISPRNGNKTAGANLVFRCTVDPES